MRATKIYVTVGPTTSLSIIKQIIRLGIIRFRINFSHGKIEDHNAYFSLLKQAEADLQTRLIILGDIQGPKFRIGKTKSFLIQKNQQFVFDQNDLQGNEERVCLPHVQFFSHVGPGNKLLLNDGDIELEVTSNTGQVITTICKRSGEISSFKGISAPGVAFQMQVLTEFDKECINNGIHNGMSICMLSFIQSAVQVREILNFIQKRCQIMSKIENQSAFYDCDAICKLSDYVMVARGDLAVETQLFRVANLQRQILAVCKQNRKEAVVVTQFLDSLSVQDEPSYSDINDIYQSVSEGFDGIMLTGEVAASRDPLNSVRTLIAVVGTVLSTSE